MRALVYMLIGMGIAGLIGWVISSRRRKVQDAVRARDATLNSAVARNDITAVRRGGVFHLPPFGPRHTPTETYVEEVHRYEIPGRPPWYELVCTHGKRDLLVEHGRSGGELYVTAGFDDENPSLGDLGLDEESLISFDEGKRKTFEWDGVTWRYEDSGERFYYENDGRVREGYYCWDFVDARDSRYISVEKWEGEADFKVYHLWLVDARAIEVYEAGKSGS